MRLLILDLDGTVRRTESGATFISDPFDQEIIPEAAKAIASYYRDGWVIVGCTNQGGCAAIDDKTGKPYKSIESAIEEQQQTMNLETKIDSILFCPDFEGEVCYQVPHPAKSIKFKKYLRSQISQMHTPGLSLLGSFRKPGSGMLMLAIELLKKYPDEVLMVGDRPEDEQATIAACISFKWAKDWWTGG